MIKDKDERHRYGQHYTPVEVAQLLAAFAVRSADDLVFDPSCGDGRLLMEAFKRKESFHSTETNLVKTIYGIDRSASAVRLAARTGARVACADFFDIEPGAVLNGSNKPLREFDALIGNPPYIRQEVMGARDKRRVEKRLEKGRTESPEIFWPRWSGRSDTYVYFFAHSARFLRPGGRIVFLTASSWLDVGYGAALRQFLLENFRVIAILESAAESFFNDASINTAITVLEREPDRAARAQTAVRFVQLIKPIHEIFGDVTAIEFARSIERTDSPVITPTHRIRIINEAGLLDEDKRVAQTGSGWGKYLRAADVFFHVIERGSTRLKHLSDLARVRFGVKTGANEFFYLKGARGRWSGVRGQGPVVGEEISSVAMRRLGDLAVVRRGLTTGANEFFYLRVVSESESSLTPDRRSLTPVECRSGARHVIESQYLSPVIFSLKEISGIVIGRNDSKKLFFNCPDPRSELIGTNALEYIQAGERAGYHLRPTCAARDPWYSVARRMKPAPLILPSKVGERWVVALNHARVFEDKKLYGVFPRGLVSQVVLAALLNSTWARFYTEVTCRQMTGAQAIADIDVNVAERIMIPDPREIAPGLKRRLESALNALARRPIFSVFEEVKRADRRRLDTLVLSAIGFTDRSEREVVLDQLYAAVIEIVSKRQKAVVSRQLSVVSC